jgi:hypothetical protein
VGRSYAGILGTIAFIAVVLQGCLQATQPRQVLESAILSTMAFWAIGYAIGALAGWIVQTSIKDHEIAALLGPFGAEPIVRQVDN